MTDAVLLGEHSLHERVFGVERGGRWDVVGAGRATMVPSRGYASPDASVEMIKKTGWYCRAYTYSPSPSDDLGKTALCTALSAEYLPWRRSAV